MRAVPFTFVLSSVKWDIFCTLTFRRECKHVETAAAMGLDWIERCRVRMRLAEEEFYWFLRPERGELFGRVHLHALVRARSRDRSLFVVPRGMVSAAHRLWARGMTSFRVVEDSYDPAAWYLQKEKSCGSDVYESEKSSASRHGIPSPALLMRAGLQQSAGEVVVGAAVSGSTLTDSLELA
jgi:hypothetical protein